MARILLKWWTMSEDTSELEALLQRKGYVILIKGPPEDPASRFGAEMVLALVDAGIGFHAVNVLQEATVGRAAQESEGWPTFPMAFLDGKFVGGVDHLRGHLETLTGHAGDDLLDQTPDDQLSAVEKLIKYSKRKP